MKQLTAENYMALTWLLSKCDRLKHVWSISALLETYDL